MKKVCCILVFLAFIIPAVGLAEINLASMSYQELVELRDQIDLAIWTSQEWQEVTVPQGVYEVGKDIPDGHWTVKPIDGAQCIISWGSELEEGKKDIAYSGSVHEFTDLCSPTNKYFKKGRDKSEEDIELANGQFVVITYSDMIFTPYAGKPSLGFK